MDPKEFVRKNYIQLTEAIVDEVDGVVTFLYHEGVISSHMKENLIENNNTKRKKTWDLLDLIVKRGPNALDHLYNAVLAEQLFGAADIIKPEKAPHLPRKLAQPQPSIDEYDSPDEGLPDSWPSKEAIEAYKTARLVEDRHRKMNKLFADTHTPKGQDSTYLMSAKPRGQVLIINNEIFSRMADREGTIQDRKALEKLFNTLDFDVQVERNATKEKMWKILVEESKRDVYHKDANCFVLFILSHGHTGVVFGTDGDLKDGQPVNCLEIKAITDLFCHSKALLGKPKLFFIQACQGVAKNEGHPVGEADHSDNAESQKSTVATATGPSTESAASASSDIALGDVEYARKQEVLVRETKTVLDDLLDTTQHDAFGDKIPSGADVFVAMATIPGFLSYRNTAIGTWFIQAIAYVFAKYSYKHDLHKLMTLVNNLVGRAETEKGRYKQVCEKKDSFQRDFYFFPGLYDQWDK